MPDIFVSYAHVDNEIFADAKLGWVTHFRNNLRIALARAIGRKENIDVWMDSRLDGNDAITPEIEEKLKASHTLCILLSPGWIASKWCQKELVIFCNSHRNLDHRIYVIELNDLKSEDKHTALRDLKGYRFWYKNEEDRIRLRGFPEPQAADTVYFGRLSDISNDVAQALANFRPEITTKTETFTPKTTIYVAPVNDALYDQRASLVSELRQFQIAVLPEKNALPADAASELDKCLHFVQLLSADSMMGIPQQQLAIAEKAGKPVMQWRDPQLNIAADSINQEHKQLLEHKTVIAAALPDFIRMVRETVLPEKKSEHDLGVTAGNKMIFVHTGPEDIEHARNVAKILRQKKYGIALPSFNGKPEEIRLSIEHGYKHCNILLFLQQRTPAITVNKHLEEAFDKIKQLEKEISILICQSQDSEEISFLPPGLHQLECNHNFHENCLEQFLQQVKP